jgi:hypothetical protein
MFFQLLSDDIDDLPDSVVLLVDKVTWIPELLKDARADSTNKSYNWGFIRFE